MANVDPNWTVAFVAHSGDADAEVDWLGAEVVHSGAADAEVIWVGAEVVHSGLADAEMVWVGGMVVHDGIAAGGGGSPVQGEGDIQYDAAFVQGFNRQAGNNSGGQIN